ncbi:hypothetical protein Vretifemale_12371, partial [Volvox reticuliferus]
LSYTSTARPPIMHSPFEAPKPSTRRTARADTAERRPVPPARWVGAAAAGASLLSWLPSTSTPGLAEAAGGPPPSPCHSPPGYSTCSAQSARASCSREGVMTAAALLAVPFMNACNQAPSGDPGGGGGGGGCDGAVDAGAPDCEYPRPKFMIERPMVLPPLYGMGLMGLMGAVA